jgi:hypothetical protein
VSGSEFFESTIAKTIIIEELYFYQQLTVESDPMHEILEARVRMKNIKLSLAAQGPPAI